MRLRFPLPLLFLIVFLIRAAVGQSPSATISGLVLDPSGRAIAGAELLIVNDVTGIRYPGATNGEGIYAVPNLPPGPYRIQVSKVGFKTLIKPDITLNVQDALAVNFTLPVGAASETVTVQGGGSLANTESAAVSTVVDRNFTENLPMNGRSFQALIQLTPGVVLTPANGQDGGQFSVNGQRANANYFTVDGVSANVSMNGVGNGGLSQMGGASLPGFGVLGGTNTLVSVDAMQEFRMQTSTYAPEFGRTPGAQVAIATRSGTNAFHGTLFEYLRNDLLDSNDWFANANSIARSRERINDFGGVFGGPIVKGKTFFFFSYEGQRLRLPQTGITTVPSLAARKSAPAEIQPYINAFPIPNGPDLGDGQAPFNTGFSDKSGLNAESIRIDHVLTHSLTVFGRYNYAPSDLSQRGGGGGNSLNELVSTQFHTQTLTAGGTWTAPMVSNELRFNFSRNEVLNQGLLDDFGGATVPSDSILFPSQYTRSNALYDLFVITGQQMNWFVGRNADNIQRQINLVDGLTWVKGAHTFKFGVDYLRLSPRFGPGSYAAGPFFIDVPSLAAENPLFAIIFANRGGTLAFRDFGTFAQDTWRVLPGLTLTFGVRWELEPAPSATSGPDFLAVTGFGNAATLNLASPGTEVWKTRYGNFAPRFGAAYQLSNRAGYETILRGGFGVFYDLATQEVGNALGGTSYPFGGLKFLAGNVTFPLTADEAQPPAITPTLPLSSLTAFDPNLRLPYTLQYNLAVQQSLGPAQSLSISGIGALGRRLLQGGELLQPNANFGFVKLFLNAATSDYSALQVQFQRRLSGGLQTLASYTWAHSIDNASSDSLTAGNFYVQGPNAGSNRGPSDFDVRHSFSVGLTYEFPTPRRSAFLRAALGGWATDNLIQIRSAAPVNIRTTFPSLNGATATIRPDVVPGNPFYLHGPSYPGGMIINADAFTNPPTDPRTGAPLRQGDLGRNALRGFGASQWDFAVHRQVHLGESAQLQFRAEFFNILNHPNFGSPVNILGNPLFGRSTQMLNRGLGAGGGDGSFSALYQIGGPRSIQVGMKISF
jgi:hypothetical protein